MPNGKALLLTTYNLLLTAFYLLLTMCPTARRRRSRLARFSLDWRRHRAAPFTTPRHLPRGDRRYPHPDPKIRLGLWGPLSSRISWTTADL